MQQKKTKKLLKIGEKKFKRTRADFFAEFYLFSPKKIKTKGKHKNQKMWLVFAGSLMGFLNGFFGGGGGMVCVPILQKFLSLDAKHSHATAIMVIFPLSVISAIIYVINGYITTEPLISVGIGVVIGGILGSFALKFLPPKAVRIIFAVIMFAGGIKLII
ncbi:MAG: sulfite exporter TauE/SafE family protein [Clostridia bacterium]|nr:sulfite exporter TauE/SafE family protein [Clostridia bacterium]